MAAKTGNLSVELISVAASYGLLNTLGGNAFCQTGALSITRSEMVLLIQGLDGVVHDTIKSGTIYLIVPNEENFRKGSKYKAAESAGKVIITEKQFCELILPSIDDLLGDGNEGSEA